jgi:3-methyladenine DNA glycosylase Tag
MDNNLMLKYQLAKTIVQQEGFQDEISWQSKLCFDNLDESSFLRETAWVILTCGMKEAIIRNKFEAFSECFFHWSSARKITANREKCEYSALKIFNNRQKISAILNAAEQVKNFGFETLKKKIQSDPINYLQIFDYIGPVTVYHLAKNIGLPVAKPDRHLVRIAQQENYCDVQSFCGEISRLSGDSVPVVDIVFWRFATIDNDYLNVLSSLNESEYGNENNYQHSDENYIYNPEFSKFQ